ncbi:MAG: DUF1501 domain-containing protein [Polyangiales bacterium]
MQRRAFLFSSVGALAIAPLARAGGKSSGKKILVVILQRGAVDGLTMVPAIGDKLYSELRPKIAVGKKEALPLDGPFALHPSLKPLLPLWSNKSLAVVHAVGSPDSTRSHFDAQDYLETGTPGSKSTLPNGEGWLARVMNAKTGKSSLRAIAIAPTLPRILRGDPDAVAFGAIDAFKVGAAQGSGSFESMYEGALDEALRGAGKEAFSAMHTLDDAKVKSIAPKNGATYPQGSIGKRLKQIAQLIHGDVGLEVAVTDCGGWDTHVNQKPQLDKRLEELGKALSAFATDLGDRMADVCVVTATEFGRTVKENGSAGTDHGHGSVMLVMGGGVKGKRVLGTWKGLSELHEGRDLPVTTDHRTVFGEILHAHLGIADTSAIFPKHSGNKLGLF